MISSRKIFFGLLISLGWVILSFQTSCSFKEPQMPQYVVPLRIPFEPQQFKIIDEITPGLIDSIGVDSMLFLGIGGEIGTVTLQTKDMSILPGTTHKTITLDTLNILSASGQYQENFSITMLFPFLADVPGGQEITVPDSTYSLPQFVIPSPNYQMIRLYRGEVDLTIQNKLPFTIAPSTAYPHAIKIVVFNSQQADPIDSLIIDDPILPGKSIQWTKKIVGDNFQLEFPLTAVARISIPTPTSILVTDSLLQNAGLSIAVEIKNIKAREVIGKIEPQKFQRKISLPLTNSNRLIEGKINRGSINFIIDNRIPLGATVSYRIPAFLTNGGKVFRDSVQIASKKQIQYFQRFDGYSISNPESPGNFIDSLYIWTTIFTKASAENVHIFADDAIDIQVIPDSISFSHFKGFLKTDFLTVPEFRKDNITDYSGIESGFRFENVELEVVLNNQINIENLLLNFDLQGYRNTQSGDSLLGNSLSFTNLQINPGVPGAPSITRFTFSGENIFQFINQLPTAIRGSGSVQYGGLTDVTAGESKISGEYRLCTPLKFSVSNLNPIKSDISVIKKEDVSQDFRKTLAQDVAEIQLVLDTENHTPLAGELILIISSDTSQSGADFWDISRVDSTKKIVRRLNFSAASTDPQTGRVVQSNFSEQRILLNQTETQIFSRPPLKYGYILKISDTSTPVVLSGSDFVEIKGEAIISVRVKE